MAARKDRGRLPNGAGSIYQRASDSRWVGATYVLTTDVTRRRKVVYGATWEEAHTKLFAIQDRDRRGLPAPHDAPTVAEYLEYWLEQIVHIARRPATYAKYESMVRVHVVPHLGEKRLDRLTVRRLPALRQRPPRGGHLGDHRPHRGRDARAAVGRHRH